MYGFGGNLLTWFSNYLSSRKQKVVCEGATTDAKPVLGGVPQGSILGPLLFLLYINDITDYCLSLVYLYAEDSTLMAPITCEDNNQSLWESLRSLVDWGLTFNPNKCKFISFSRKAAKIYMEYQIDGTNLEWASSLLDSGLLVDHKLSWNEHIDMIVSKNDKRSGFVKRPIGFNANINTMRKWGMCRDLQRKWLCLTILQLMLAACRDCTQWLCY